MNILSAVLLKDDIYIAPRLLKKCTDFVVNSKLKNTSTRRKGQGEEIRNCPTTSLDYRE